MCADTRRRRDQLGPGRVRNVYDVLVRLMTAAVDDKVIASSPCRRTALPAMPDEEVTPPTVEQDEAMPRALPPYIRAAVVTLAGSGLRIGELLGLKVSDVDFKAGTIRVERQRLQSGRIGPPKTAKPRRTVPVGDVVTDALLVHLAARPSKGWLFTMEEGEPLNCRRWKTEWNCARKALQAAEDEAAEREGHKPVELPRRVPHDLRHFYASALIAGGASVKQVRGPRPHIRRHHAADLCAPVAGRRRPHPVRYGRRARRPADRVRTGRRCDPRNRRSNGLAKDQAFLVSQKILSIWAM